MYDIIEAAEGIDESSVPSQAYVPEPLGGAGAQDAGYTVGGAGAASSGGVRAGTTVFDADAHK